MLFSHASLMSGKKFRTRKSFQARFPGWKQKSGKTLKWIPNGLTLSALCSGMTGMRFALDGAWYQAIICICFAIVLDGIDGKVARLLNASSLFGGELDSLADLVNFGVVPGLMMYVASLKTYGTLGWIISLFFLMAMAIRLARFNTMAFHSHGQSMPPYSVGIPAPCGAAMALMPLVGSLAFDINLSPIFAAVAVFLSALGMVSTWPTFSSKAFVMKKSYRLPLVLSLCLIIQGLVLSFALTVFALMCLYAASLIISGMYYGYVSRLYGQIQAIWERSIKRKRHSPQEKE